MATAPAPGARSGADPAGMLRAAGQVEAGHQQIHRIQSVLAQQFEQVRAGWSGPASAAFFKAYQQFDSEFERVKAGLDEIHERLVDTHRDYTAIADQQRASVNRIAALINVPPTR